MGWLERQAFQLQAYYFFLQVSKDVPIFSEGVTKSKFFYMDSLLLSTSSNK